MSNEVKHRLELFLCAKLTAAVSGLKALPMTGFGLSDSETSLEPPFTVVMVTTATKSHDSYSIWLCEGAVQVVTHVNETGSDQHSAMVKQIYDALGAIAADTSNAGFVFSGLSIMKTRTADDSEHACHVDAFDFQAGCEQQSG